MTSDRERGEGTKDNPWDAEGLWATLDDKTRDKFRRTARAMFEDAVATLATDPDSPARFLHAVSYAYYRLGHGTADAEAAAAWLKVSEALNVNATMNAPGGRHVLVRRRPPSG